MHKIKRKFTLTTKLKDKYDCDAIDWSVVIKKE